MTLGQHEVAEVGAAATILGAEIQFKANGSNSGFASLDIQADDTGSAAAIIESNSNLSSRSRTQAQINWIPPAWTDGERGWKQLSPDIKSVVQEVVDRPDWQSSNNLMILISGTGKRRAMSYNENPNMSPKITITYLLPGTQPEQVYYYHNDHLGTPQIMTDAGGNIVWFP